MSAGDDVSGWNAFDAPTRAWLAARLREAELHNCKRIASTREREVVRAALLALGAERAALLARRTGLPLEAVRAHVLALAGDAA